MFSLKYNYYEDRIEQSQAWTAAKMHQHWHIFFENSGIHTQMGKKTV